MVAFTVVALAGCGTDDTTVNHAPIARPIADQLVLAGQSLDLILAADDPDGDTLAWSMVESPAGTALDTTVARLTWNPTPTDTGAHLMVVQVTDDGDPPLYDLLAFQVQAEVVETVNLPPLFLGLPTAGDTTACAPFSASFEALDPEGGEVTYHAVNLPAGASLTTVGTTATLAWEPAQTVAGRFEVGIYATDLGGASTAIAYTIDVSAPPAMAVVTPYSAQTIGGQPLDLMFQHSRHPCYTLSATGLPAGATLDPAAQRVTWTTTPADFGLYDVTLTLTDRASATVTDQTQITVTFLDEFEVFTGWTTRDVNLTTCCQGPTTYSAAGSVLTTASTQPVDVHGYAFRSFTRTVVPIRAVAVLIRGRDVVSGPACGSGVGFKLLDTAITDPAVTFPNWDTEPAGVGNWPLPDGAGVGNLNIQLDLPTPTLALTPVLVHSDNSNLCTVTGYWSSITMVPFAEP